MLCKPEKVVAVPTLYNCILFKDNGKIINFTLSILLCEVNCFNLSFDKSKLYYDE